MKDLIEIQCAIRNAVVIEDWETINIKPIFVIEPTHVLYIHEQGVIGRNVDDFNGMDAVQKHLLDDDMVDHVCEEVVEVTGAEIISVLMEDTTAQDILDAKELLQYLYVQLGGE